MTKPGQQNWVARGETMKHQNSILIHTNYKHVGIGKIILQHLIKVLYQLDADQNDCKVFIFVYVIQMRWQLTFDVSFDLQNELIPYSLMVGLTAHTD